MTTNYRRERETGANTRIDQKGPKRPSGKSTPAAIEVYANAASRIIAIYQPHIHERTQDENEARRLRQVDAAERTLRLAAPRGERTEIIRLLRRHQISDETSRKLVHEIDLLASRYR